MRRRV
ncbi:hypothetical protein YPPY45_2145, partial [Yersinia pestis PY-45]